MPSSGSSAISQPRTPAQNRARPAWSLASKHSATSWDVICSGSRSSLKDDRNAKPLGDGDATAFASLQQRTNAGSATA